MGRRFTQASSERIHSNTTASLAGFNMQWGTVACLVYQVSLSGGQQSFCCTNLGVANYFQFFVDPSASNKLGIGIAADATSTVAISASKLWICAGTKPNGSVAPNLHAYDVAAGTWTHATSAQGLNNADVTTAFTIGSYDDQANKTPLDAEMFQLALWNDVAMSDVEVERLARVTDYDWRRLGPTGPAFYERMTDRREVGDMVNTIGRHNLRQTSRTGTTRGAQPGPSGFVTYPPRRRR